LLSGGTTFATVLGLDLSVYSLLNSRSVKTSPPTNSKAAIANIETKVELLADSGSLVFAEEEGGGTTGPLAIGGYLFSDAATTGDDVTAADGGYRVRYKYTSAASSSLR
jgi:hypothetical protein